MRNGCLLLIVSNALWYVMLRDSFVRLMPRRGWGGGCSMEWGCGGGVGVVQWGYGGGVGVNGA